MCYIIIPKQFFSGEMMKSVLLLLAFCLTISLCSFHWEDITPPGGEVTICKRNIVVASNPQCF